MRAPVGSKFIAEDLRAALRVATSARCHWQHTLSTFTTFLLVHDRILERKPKPVDRFELVRREFGNQLTRHRGLRPATVADYDHWIGDFLRRSLPADRPLSSLTAASFEHYIKDRLPELASSTLHTAFNCIRAFLKYSFEAGLISSRADVVDRPASIGEDRPPRVGRRDYLIMHLMAHYGLRTGEAGFLKVDSVDWKRKTLTVNQVKTSSTLLLPIDDRTVRLFHSYLENDRPKTGLPWIFLKANAPEGPMTKFALSQVFRTRAARSGLPITHCSAYALRHSFAMRLFGRGVGIKAIGDLMGHSNLVSTGVYLRLQTDVLRDVALPVPRVARNMGGAV